MKLASSKISYAIVIIVLIVLAAYFLATGTLRAGAGANAGAANEMAEIYRLITDKDVEIISTDDVSGLTRVRLSVEVLGVPRLEEVFVTRDGKFLATGLVSIEEFRGQIEKEKEFAGCLDRSGVRILGLTDDRNTQAQLLALGRFSGTIFIDCSTNLEVCQQLNVTSVPMILYNNTLTQGPANAQAFEAATGCRV